MTGEPLENAEVFLVKKLDGLKIIKTMYSNKNGKFKFDYLRKGIYAVNVMREGYATFGKIADLHFKNLKDISPPVPSFYFALPEKTKTFGLKKGKKKFVQIRLQKEAIFLINASHKFPEGINYKGNMPLKKI